MTKLTNEEAIKEVIKAAVELAIIRHSLTFEDEDGRADFDMYSIAADAANAAFGIDTCAEEPVPEVTEILKRMAEGAAGEASPQGDLLAALKGMVAVADSEKWHNQSLFSAKALAAAKARNAIKNYESGSASTAGPHPMCPKCGYADGLPLYPPTEIQPNIEVACPHCGFSVMPKVDERGYVDLEALAQFFAAAPAEDAKEKRELSKAEARGLAAELIDYAEGRVRSLDEIEHQIGIEQSEPADVQLDVEGLAREIAEAIRHKQRLTNHYRDEMLVPLIQLALLRRVSGKGASVHELLKDALSAPVPATPDVRIKFVCPDRAPDVYSVFLNGQVIASFDFEHEAQALADKVKVAVNSPTPATTQGTLEGL